MAIATAALASLTLPAPMQSKLGVELWKNIIFVAEQMWEILPYILFSVSASAWATVSGFAEKIRGVFSRQEKVAVAGAALAGATVPFCSCGVLPLIAAMLTGGVPLAPIMAFWISSPLMSPEMFLLTSGTLGLDYAAGRLVAA
ncbi:MAG: permease, partial [Nitrospinaceae bacterium]|nr:permease [Nitrospinaceae bacterium]